MSLFFIYEKFWAVTGRSSTVLVLFSSISLSPFQSRLKTRLLNQILFITGLG